MPEEYRLVTLTKKTLDRSIKFQSGAEQKYKIPWTQVDSEREK
jgi:hypothetical protein